MWCEIVLFLCVLETRRHYICYALFIKTVPGKCITYINGSAHECIIHFIGRAQNNDVQKNSDPSHMNVMFKHMFI